MSSENNALPLNNLTLDKRYGYKTNINNAHHRSKSSITNNRACLFYCKGTEGCGLEFRYWPRFKSQHHSRDVSQFNSNWNLNDNHWIPLLPLLFSLALSHLFVNTSCHYKSGILTDTISAFKINRYLITTFNNRGWRDLQPLKALVDLTADLG